MPTPHKRNATVTIALTPGVKSRLESLRIIPEESYWRVLERLLDEHDARSRAATPTTPREEAVA
jgi:hypothetical protein